MKTSDSVVEKLLGAFRSGSPYALLEDSRSSPESASNFFFERPVEEIVANRAEDLPSALRRIEDLSARGLFLCGGFSYEAGHCLVPKPMGLPAFLPHPLVHFFAFENLLFPRRGEIEQSLAGHLADCGDLCVYEPESNESKAEYLESLRRIRRYIENGDAYQVNYTFRFRFKLQGGLVQFYSRLRENQRVKYGGILNFPGSEILTLSPELFLRRNGDRLIAQPMKGTAPRSADADEDLRLKEELAADPKNRSENVMIVDLIRNDLGKICETGSVEVEEAFQVRSFETLHQMISTVKGRVGENHRFGEAVCAMFPCGSVTGAPKIRAMEIIRELEREPRGIYAGGIGYLLPNRDFCLNVPIRTIRLEEGNRCSMGIGSGITHLSNPEGEWRESWLKARFAKRVNEAFFLFETLLYDHRLKAFRNLEDHMERIRLSAKFFGFAHPGRRFEDDWRAYAEARNPDCDLRVKVELEWDGKYRFESRPVSPVRPHPSPKVVLSDTRIDSGNAFQAHKTSNRNLYDSEWKRFSAEGYHDALYLNEKGLLCEASRHNVVLRMGGTLYTPPLSSGALPGVMRKKMLAENLIREKDLDREDLENAEQIYLINSLRGQIAVDLSRFRETRPGEEF